MRRKAAVTPQGRAFLRPSVTKRAGRPRVRIRGLNRAQPLPDPIYINGVKLNREESVVARALIDLKINFVPQAQIGPKNELGGGLADFLLPDLNIVIEYDGPFHRTTGGSEKDFWRTVTRKQAGYVTVRITFQDLPNIHQRLMELVANPTIASVMTGAK